MAAVGRFSDKYSQYHKTKLPAKYGELRITSYKGTLLASTEAPNELFGKTLFGENSHQTDNCFQDKIDIYFEEKCEKIACFQICIYYTKTENS